MHRRDLASLVALSTLALTVGVGCPEEPKPTPPKPVGATSAAAAVKTPPSAAASAAPVVNTKAGPLGTATIKGVVNFSGKAPEMKVPKKRKDAEFCKTKEVKYNAVLADGGKLAETFVRIANDSVKGEYPAPAKHAEIDQVDCMYTPRIQGVVAGQEITIKNSDGTLHNVHAVPKVNEEFNFGQPNKGDERLRTFDRPEIMVPFRCDVHGWMNSYAGVVPHPFYAVTSQDGSFEIKGLPAGTYTLEAWHERLGTQTASVTSDGKTPVTATFTFKGDSAS